jgi:hypothetical protein
MSRYICDPDVIPDRQSRWVLFAHGSCDNLTLAALATLLVLVPFSLQVTDDGDITLGSRKAHTRYWGGSSALAYAFLTSLQSLTGPVGELFPSCLGGAAVCVLGMHPHLTMEPSYPVSDVLLDYFKFYIPINRITDVF